MEPGKKIQIIQSVAEELSNSDWGYIDLVLETCNVPTRTQWGGDSRSYVIEMIKGQDDKTLTLLSEVVGLQEEAEQPSRINLAAPDRFNLFISHLTAHQKFAAQLQAELKKFGISSFVAHNDIQPTEEWQSAIEGALRSCDALIALLHPGFHESFWTDQEIGFVMGRSKPAFTVAFGEPPYGFISRFQAFNGANKTPVELAGEIFSKLLENKDTNARLAFSLARAFENSGSYARSVELIEYLEKLEAASPEVQSTVASALTGNSQVYGEGLHNVPQRTKTLLDLWKSK